jgi:mRNA interferase YafQ
MSGTKYTVKRTSKFKKEYKLAIKRGLDISLLQAVIRDLATGEPLDAKYKDHELSGNFTGHRECHIQSNWLLVYYKSEDILVLTLVRTGTHSDIFNE